jgi:hypothetical protein
MGGLCCTHAEIHGLTMCNTYGKSQGHHVKGFEQMAEKKKRHHQSAKSTQIKVTKTRHITQIDPKRTKEKCSAFCALCASLSFPDISRPTGSQFQCCL